MCAASTRGAPWPPTNRCARIAPLRDALQLVARFGTLQFACRRARYLRRGRHRHRAPQPRVRVAGCQTTGAEPAAPTRDPLPSDSHLEHPQRSLRAARCTRAHPIAAAKVAVRRRDREPPSIARDAARLPRDDRAANAAGRQNGVHRSLDRCVERHVRQPVRDLGARDAFDCVTRSRPSAYGRDMAAVAPGEVERIIVNAGFDPLLRCLQAPLILARTASRRHSPRDRRSPQPPPPSAAAAAPRPFARR